MVAFSRGQGHEPRYFLGWKYFTLGPLYVGYAACHPGRSHHSIIPIPLIPLVPWIRTWAVPFSHPARVGPVQLIAVPAPASLAIWGTGIVAPCGAGDTVSYGSERRGSWIAGEGESTTEFPQDNAGGETDALHLQPPTPARRGWPTKGCMLLCERASRTPGDVDARSSCGGPSLVRRLYDENRRMI